MIIYVLTSTNKIVKTWAIPLNENHIPLVGGVKVETDIDLEKVNIIDNFKLENGELVELEENEKPTVEPQPSTDDKIIVLSDELAQLTKENSQLWDTVEYLLKATEVIPPIA